MINLNYAGIPMMVLLLFMGCGGNDDLPEREVDQPESKMPFNDWDTPPENLYVPPVEVDRIKNEGNVHIGLRITREGTVDSVWVVQTSTFHILDSLALETALRMTFTPAKKDDMPVSSLLVFPFQFRQPVPQDGEFETNNN